MLEASETGQHLRRDLGIFDDAEVAKGLCGELERIREKQDRQAATADLPLFR